jgi:hypothetical protein
MHHKDAPTASPDEILCDILDVVTALRDGHFTTRLNEAIPGVGGRIARVLNEHLEMLVNFRTEHHRLMEEIGVTGRLGGQVEIPAISGAWKEMADEMNRMGGNLTNQFRDGCNVVRDLLHDELSSRMSARNIQGEFREFREKLNDLADRFQQQSQLAAVGE